MEESGSSSSGGKTKTVYPIRSINLQDLVNIINNWLERDLEDLESEYEICSSEEEVNKLIADQFHHLLVPITINIIRICSR